MPESDRPVVVIADGSLHPYHDFAVEHERWTRAGFDVRLEACQDEQGLISASSDVDAVAFWGIKVPFTRRVIESLNRCRVIVRYGTGVDSVDLEAASERGILVAAPLGFCTQEVAAHATALILTLARRIPFLDRHMQRGGWRDDSSLIQGVQRLSQQTLGLMGFGRIAQQVARNLRPMVGRVIATDPYVDPAVANDLQVKLTTLPKLLEESDLVSIHVPLTDDTSHLLGPPEFELMKTTAFLVNTSRGAIVDETALVRALETGQIAGAALDVFTTTPLPADSPLRGIENLVLTPHFAANSDQAKEELFTGVAEIVEDALLGRRPRGVLNPYVLDDYRTP